MVELELKKDFDYKLIFDRLRDAVFIHDFNMNILEVNSATCNRLGYTRDEMLKMKIEDIDSPEFAKYIPERVKAMKKNGELIFESAQIDSNGRVIPVEVSSSMIEIDNKPAVLSIARDISDRKKAKQEQEELIKQQLVIAEISSLLVSADNFDESIIKILQLIGTSCGADRICLSKINLDNKNIENTHNWYRNGKENIKLIPPEIYPFWEKRLKDGKAVEIGNLSDLNNGASKEKMLLEAAGIRSLLIIPLLDKTETLYGFFGLYKEDYSTGCYTDRVKELSTLAKIVQIALERKNLEIQTQKQKDLLSTAIESLPHPFYMIDINNYKILFANSATSKFGNWYGSTCYKTTHDRNTPCDSDDHQCPLIKVKKTGLPTIMEHIHYDDKGNPINVEVHGYPVFDESDKIVSMIEYSLDITEKKLLLTKLEIEKQKAERADKLKSQFLANMSHEIRTPLNSIIGFLDLTIANDDLQDKYREYLGYSLESGKLLLSLINDILDLSKIEAGQLEIESVPFSLEQIMDSVMSSANILLSDKKEVIDLRFSTSKVLENNLIGDPYRLEQILNNLISNAIKFTSIGFIECGVSLINNTTLEFYVRDSGIGIEEHSVKKLFIPFSQADSSTTREYGGTGLGLTITKQLIELMGGYIRVKSQKGEGSSFYFTLPYTFVPNTNIDKLAKDNSNINKNPTVMKKILIAEDEISNQKLLDHILTKNGYSIRIAQDGRDAVSIFKTDPSIDAVLMDIGMPHLNGIDAVSVIRDIEKKNSKIRIPIIAITAFAMKGDREKCIDAGFDEYLTKPLDQKLLLTTLEKYFKRNLNFKKD